MKNRRLMAKLACTVISLSLLCTGCGQKGTDSKTEATTETTTEVTTEATTEVTTENAQANEWEVAKVSGTIEDFEEYFNIDVAPYKKACDKSGNVTEISYYSEIVGADRQAYVYTPYDYDESIQYPVVYLIHGIGCDGGQWVSMGAANIFDNMIANGEVKPFVAVFPSVIPTDGIDPNTLSDTNIKAFTDFVDEYKTDLAPYIAENYSVSTLREDTAVCGLSMGGMEALTLGFSLLDSFNYIGSFSAAPTLDTSLLTTEGSEYIPALVLVCSGDADGTVQDNPYNYHMTLSKNNVEHIWYQHPGGGHSPNVWDLGLVNFLKRIF